MRIFTLVGLAVLLLASAGGCEDLGQSVDCHQACEKLEYCSEGELDLGYCHDRCSDDSDEQQELHGELLRCTDCLDQAYNCSEVASKCPLCVEVQAELIAAQPADGSGGGANNGGAPAVGGGAG